jgi:hypothetical protein
MANEIMVPPSQLREGDRIGNWAGILLNVTVRERDGARVVFERPDGSTFATSLPCDAMLLVRVPRPALRVVA